MFGGRIVESRITSPARVYDRGFGCRKYGTTTTACNTYLLQEERYPRRGRSLSCAGGRVARRQRRRPVTPTAPRFTGPSRAPVRCRYLLSYLRDPAARYPPPVCVRLRFVSVPLRHAVRLSHRQYAFSCAFLVVSSGQRPGEK